MGARLDINGPSTCTGTDCEDSAFSFSICNAGNCSGYWAVYRIQFALSAFHLLMALGTACKGSFATTLQRGYWIAKVFMLVGFLGGTLFMSNDAFAYYAWIARFIAPFFLLFQFILLIDFAYSFNSYLLELDETMTNFGITLCGAEFSVENQGGKYTGLMAFLSLAMYAGCITGIVVLYTFWSSDCAFNSAAITTTLIFGVLNTVISLFDKLSPHGSILCSGGIFLYSTYLCFAAVSALPVDSCNPLYNWNNPNSAGHVVLLCISMGVAGFVVAYFAYRMGSSSLGKNSMTGGASKAPSIADTPTASSINDTANTSADHGVVKVKVEQIGDDAKPVAEPAAEEPVEEGTYFWYHLKMIFLSTYMAMLLTDWGVPADTTSAHDAVFSKGYVSAWLMLSANWVCCILYLWSLIAPVVCSGRDFT